MVLKPFLKNVYQSNWFSISVCVCLLLSTGTAFDAITRRAIGARTHLLSMAVMNQMLQLGVTL